MSDNETRMDKVVCLGIAKDEYYDRFSPLYCRIQYDGERLSITGVHGPLPNGDVRASAPAGRSCGQLSLPDYSFKRFEAGWNHEKVNMLAFIWENFHLNDMNAGTAIQTFFLENYKKVYGVDVGFGDLEYLLSEAGLNPDPFTGHRYGTSWLYNPVPNWAIEWLKNLPETNK